MHVYAHTVVAKNIMEALGGDIGVSSEGEDCGGTTFYIDLPLTRIDDSYLAPLQQAGELVYDEKYNVLTARPIPAEDPTVTSTEKQVNTFTATSPKSLPNGLTLLIVDDSLTNRKMVSRVLQEHFAQVHEAFDGADALRKHAGRVKQAGRSYDVIMMDSEMPNMSGPEAVRELRKLGFSGLIVGVSGSAQDADTEAFIASGLDRLLCKPLDVPEFLRLVRARSPQKGGGKSNLSVALDR